MNANKYYDVFLLQYITIHCFNFPTIYSLYFSVRRLLIYPSEKTSAITLSVFSLLKSLFIPSGTPIQHALNFELSHYFFSVFKKYIYLFNISLSFVQQYV